MRILKWIGYLLIALLVLAGVLAFFNWDKLVRLNAANTLFAEENIVTNFSGMEKVFFNRKIPTGGEIVTWETDEKSLPETFPSGTLERNLSDWLAYSKSTSLLVVQDGKIAFEEYYLGTGPDDLRISWSVAKSFLSAAFGIAVDEGKVDLDQPAETYVPEFASSAYKGVTVRNVFNMASGVKLNEDYLDFWSDINKMGRVLAIGGSMDGFTLEMQEREREQGIARQYVSIDTHVLAMVLRAVTGKTLPEYLGEKIITPLGFEKQPYYLTDSAGNAFALGGLNITTRDYARFGQMFLDYGKWNGRQIVPAGWVLNSTVKSAPDAANGDVFGYGYQWWVPQGSQSNGGDYLARGIYGQYIYVNPRSKTVIVRTAANRKFRETLADGAHTSQVDVDMFRGIARHVSQQRSQMPVVLQGFLSDLYQIYQRTGTSSQWLRQIASTAYVPLQFTLVRVRTLQRVLLRPTS